MVPAWAAQYLNLPFLGRGRTREGVDCYGLVRLVYQEQLGIELPSYTEGYATPNDQQEIAAMCESAVGLHWKAIPLHEAKVFDGIIFRIMGRTTHFGLVLDAPQFLHAMDGVWSTIERWDSLAWERRVLTAVRYVG